MALEDLTGTAKYISALNPAWPVDDDWVDEGDNHLRGVKNVLKNTFPDTNGPIRWSSAQALHPDGTLALPGIGWANEFSSGFYRSASGTFGSVVGGVEKWSWDAVGFLVKSGVTFSAQGPALFANVAASGQVKSSRGYTADLNHIVDAPFYAEGPGYTGVGIGLNSPGWGAWEMVVKGDGHLWFGAQGGTGPGAIDSYGMVIQKSGTVLARAFSPITLAAGLVSPLTGALSQVLSLKGVRCVDGGSAELRVEVGDVEVAFPELVSAAGEGGAKGINYMGLVAPLIEAIRELEARVVMLETKCAGN